MSFHRQMKKFVAGLSESEIRDDPLRGCGGPGFRFALPGLHALILSCAAKAFVKRMTFCGPPPALVVKNKKFTRPRVPAAPHNRFLTAAGAWLMRSARRDKPKPGRAFRLCRGANLRIAFLPYDSSGECGRIKCDLIDRGDAVKPLAAALSSARSRCRDSGLLQLHGSARPAVLDGHHSQVSARGLCSSRRIYDLAYGSDGSDA